MKVPCQELATVHDCAADDFGARIYGEATRDWLERSEWCFLNSLCSFPPHSLFLRSLLHSLPNLQLPRLLVNQHELAAFALRLNTTDSYVFVFKT